MSAFKNYARGWQGLSLRRVQRISHRSKSFLCRPLPALLLAGFLLCLVTGSSQDITRPGIRGWGFYAHRKINRAAVFTLPPEMLRFYKRNLSYITEQAVAADKRRYVLEEEGSRHYFDTERYGKGIFRHPPRLDSASRVYGEDSLREHGMLPWHIILLSQGLSKAFRERDSLRILRTSADLGHYLADAHVPLHATANYNGQLSGQRGIHAFWETRLPELFAGSYDYFTGRAFYIPDIRSRVWSIVEQSYMAADSVLKHESALSREFPPDKKYTLYFRNRRPARDYSEHYAKAYQDLLGGMVERRMREAVISIGSFWYTAWVNAGQPSLEELGSRPFSMEERRLIDLESREYTDAGMLDRDE